MSISGIGSLLGTNSTDAVYKVGLGSNTIRTSSDTSGSGDTVDISEEAKKRPQPEVHIRGDQLTHFNAIDEVISTTKAAGIGKIAFVTSPPATP